MTLIKHGKNTEYHIKTHLIKDSLHVRLSDFASDFEFIPLETREECLVSYGMDYYIGSEYFLMEIRFGGIYQFGRDGKFIRKFVEAGQGPTEFLEGDWTVDEENQILYLSDDAKKNYFLRFDLATGKYLGDVKKAVTCRTPKIEYLNDGILMANTDGKYDENGLSDYVFWQDLSGNKIRSIPAQNTELMFWSSLSDANCDNTYRLKILNNDTLFSILDNQLIPYLTFDFGRENPPNRFHMGYINIRIFSEIEPWIILIMGTINNVTKNNLSSRMQYYMLDKKQKVAYHRGSLYIDPTHSTDNGHYITFNKNGMFVKVYQAITLLEQAEKALADPDFKEPYRSKLEAVISQLSEEDNPVLLIGRYR
ncbi:MAG: 6-bladed beta-propeller [Bacteroidota bacterium]|nr:6-bladed beta-propeller [Bacteroidota bacterium]